MSAIATAIVGIARIFCQVDDDASPWPGQSVIVEFPESGRGRTASVERITPDGARSFLEKKARVEAGEDGSLTIVSPFVTPNFHKRPYKGQCHHIQTGWTVSLAATGSAAWAGHLEHTVRIDLNPSPTQPCPPPPLAQMMPAPLRCTALPHQSLQE